MNENPELMQRLKDIMTADDLTMPLYLGHLLQTLPWYGLPDRLEKIVRQVLLKLREEAARDRDVMENVYLGVQGDDIQVEYASSDFSRA